MRQRIPTSERDTYTGRVTVDMTGQFKLFEKSGNPSREIKKGKGPFTNDVSREGREGVTQILT